MKEQDKSRMSEEIFMGEWQNIHDRITKPMKIVYQNLKLTQW